MPTNVFFSLHITNRYNFHLLEFTAELAPISDHQQSWGYDVGRPLGGAAAMFCW
jgi:hypothetical protein